MSRVAKKIEKQLRPGGWEHPEDTRNRAESELWALSERGRELLLEATPFIHSVLTIYADADAKTAFEGLREWFWSHHQSTSDAKRSLDNKNQSLIADRP